jgi:hypothetical protein
MYLCEKGNNDHRIKFLQKIGEEKHSESSLIELMTTKTIVICI